MCIFLNGIGARLPNAILFKHHSLGLTGRVQCLHITGLNSAALIFK